MRGVIAAGVAVVVLTAAMPASAMPGNRLWVRRHEGPGGANAWGKDTAVSPDGTTVFAAGYELTGPASAVATTIAYSAEDGSQLWRASYDGPADDWDTALAVAVSPDGTTVFVTGESGTDNPDDYPVYDFLTIAYSTSDGAQLWAKVYDGSSLDESHAIQVAPDGAT